MNDEDYDSVTETLLADVVRRGAEGARLAATRANTRKAASETDIVAREVERRLREQMEREAVETEAARRTAMMRQLGDDTYVPGDIVSFTKQFTKAGRAYVYAAVKRGDGLWSTTSSKHLDAIPWNELRLFLLGGKYPTETLTLLGPVDTSVKS